MLMIKMLIIFFFRKLPKEQSNSHLIVRIPLTHHYKQIQICHSHDVYQCSPEECPQSAEFVYLELNAIVDQQENDELIIYLAIKDITSHKVLEDTLACLNKKQAEKINQQYSALTNHQDLLNLKTAELRIYIKRAQSLQKPVPIFLMSLAKGL